MLKTTQTLALLCLVVMTGISQSLSDTIDQVVVTHSKVSQSLKSTSKAITVVTAEEIMESGAADLAQVLDAQTGIIINGASGNPGLNKTAYIQGGSGENLLYLIDGMPVSDPSSIGGPLDIRSIDLHSIERVEVLKGSQSTLYGSNAIAGVINIITKRHADEAISLSGSINYATYDDARQGLSLSGQLGPVGYMVLGQLSNAEGISEAREPEGSTTIYDQDGYDRKNFNAQLDFEIMDGLTVSPFYRYGAFDGKYDDGALTDATNRYDTDYSNAGVRAAYKGAKWSSFFDYSSTSTDRVFNTAFGENTFEGDLSSIEWYNSISINDNNTVLVGLNHQRMSLQDENATPVNPEDDIFSVYANYRTLLMDKINLEAGYRYNDHSKYGQNSTYELAGSYWITDDIKWQASYSTGFKAPLLSQLYGQWGANPELQPMTSMYWQTAFTYSPVDQTSLSVGYFSRDVEDIIVYLTDPVTFASQYTNLSRQKTSGIELSGRAAIMDNLSLNLNYTYLTGQTTQEDSNGQEEVTSEKLLRRPQNQLSGRLDYMPHDQWNVYVSADRVGERDELFFDFSDFSSKEEILEDYWRWNVGVTHKPYDNLTLTLAVHNLFNKQYEELYGYNTLNRHLRLGAAFTIK